MPLFYRLSIFCIIFFSASTSATVVSKEVIDRLSKAPVWHKLLHVNGDLAQINTSTFYLSSDTNKVDPRLELVKTINALLQPVNDKPNTHAQCVFRARYYWLSTQAFWSTLKVPQVHCKEYEDWSDEGEITSVSMVLATGYLSNPASFFGHLLLKFNTNQKNTQTNLLDLSINYGAIIPPNENAFVYITKGLLGGYEAGFTDGEYYEHDHNYTNIDLRDMWEYRLSLSQKETHLLLAHSWELLRNKFTYFYLTKNCGYRIAELLELVLDKPLFSKQQPWVMPVEIFRNISQYQHKGQPLLNNTKRHLSRYNQYFEKLQQLTLRENKTLKSLITNINGLSKGKYQILDTTSKIKIVDTLFDYYEIRIQKGASTQYEEAKRQLLQEMFTLSSLVKQPRWKIQKKQPPHQSQKPSVLRIGASDSSTMGNGFTLSFRPAYFDMLTPDIGIIPYAKLQMLNTEVEVYEHATKLIKLDIVDIETLSLPNTNLPDDNKLAWNISFGLDRPDINCSGCLTEKIEGGVGKAIMFNRSFVTYSYLQARFQNDKGDYDHLAIGLDSGVLIQLSPYWKLQGEFQYRDYIKSNNNPENHIKIENRFGRSKTWDVRLSYEKQRQEKIALSFGYYF